MLDAVTLCRVQNAMLDRYDRARFPPRSRLLDSLTSSHGMYDTEEMNHEYRGITLTSIPLHCSTAYPGRELTLTLHAQAHQP